MEEISEDLILEMLKILFLMETNNIEKTKDLVVKTKNGQNLKININKIV